MACLNADVESGIVLEQYCSVSEGRVTVIVQRCFV